MKKSISLLSAMLFSISLNAQQLRHWFIGPKKMDMGATNPVASPMLTTSWLAQPFTASQCANGYYDSGTSGDPIFYIADGGVYDRNNTLLGYINNASTEAAVVPFGDNNYVSGCPMKFHIFSMQGGVTTGLSLYHYVLDMNSLDLANPHSGSYYTFPFGIEFGALAVSKVINQKRNLYFMGAPGTPCSQSGQIRKIEISNNGTLSASTAVYPDPAQGVINTNAGAEVFARELDLSPDGRWLAWGSYHQSNYVPTQPGCTIPTFYRYHYIELSTSGNYVLNSYNEFNISQAINDLTVGGFRGLEFHQPHPNQTELFVGAGSDGIFKVVLPFTGTPTPLLVQNSGGTSTTSYGYSQIELANNLNMYSSSKPVPTGNTWNVGAFNPFNPQPIMFFNSQPSFTLSNPDPPNAQYSLIPNPSSDFYTLPDQIDDEDYSLITPPPKAPIVTYNSLTSSVNTTWTYGAVPNNPLGALTDIHIINELRINNNSHLTIRGMTFRFSPQAKVIIEAGSSLTLDRTTTVPYDPAVFTSNHACEDPYMWQGIEVWGNKSQSQFPPGMQGKLIVKNGSAIEFAHHAVKLTRTNYTAYTGGIVQATNAFFRNNENDIEFLPYHNKNAAGKQVGNRSYFINCDFVTDNAYPLASVGNHISITECEGISFYGCRWKNTQTGIASHTALGTGIRSLDGGFRVVPYCNASPQPLPCPAVNLIQPEFENLEFGIHATRTGRNKPFFVDNAGFANNATGIYASGINNLVITRSRFEIGDVDAVSPPSWQTGMSLIICSGYIVEENTLVQSTSTPPGTQTIGALIFNSGSAENVI